MTMSGHTYKQIHKSSVKGCDLNKDSVQSSRVSEGNYYSLKFYI